MLRNLRTKRECSSKYKHTIAHYGQEPKGGEQPISGGVGEHVIVQTHGGILLSHEDQSTDTCYKVTLHKSTHRRAHFIAFR